MTPPPLWGAAGVPRHGRALKDGCGYGHIARRLVCMNNCDHVIVIDKRERVWYGGVVGMMESNMEWLFIVAAGCPLILIGLAWAFPNTFDWS